MGNLGLQWGRLLMAVRTLIISTQKGKFGFPRLQNLTAERRLVTMTVMIKCE